MSASPHFPDAAAVSYRRSFRKAVFQQSVGHHGERHAHILCEKGTARQTLSQRDHQRRPVHVFSGKIPYDEETLRAANAFTECGRDMDDNTDYEYVCKEGTFYISKSIYVGEIIKPGEVFDLYFVVLCGDEVELRHLYRDRPRHEMVGRDTEVTDPAVIAK